MNKEQEKKPGERYHHLWQNPEEVKNVSDAVKVIELIWNSYPPSEGNRESREERIKTLGEFLSRLDVGIRMALRTAREGLSPLQQIQQSRSRLSRGARLHERRKKAWEKRGTPPDRVH